VQSAASDEETVRKLTEQYGSAITEGELEKIRQFWNPQSRNLASRVRLYRELFSEIFAVTKPVDKADADVHLYTVAINRDELSRQVESFRRQLAERNLSFRDMAHNLYNLLIKPAEAQLRGKTNIVIAADDKLWDLPFQALLTRANRFLIEDAAIAYAPSLTVLREMTRRRKGEENPGIPCLRLATRS